jgi:hypothetical protein
MKKYLSIAEYRELLSERFNHDIKRAIRGLDPLLDSDTVRRIFNEKFKGKFSQQTLKRLDWYINGGEERSAYYNVLARLDITAQSVKTIIDEWSGEYRYFRYFAKSGNRNDISYNNGGGVIIIENENNIPVFKHWSSNYSKEEAPEHAGYVYKSDHHIFMLGAGDKKMRLAVAYSVTSPKSEPIAGFVLSQRNDAPYNPFSAGFVMVHIDNSSLIKKLADKTVSPKPKNGQIKTIGEEEFIHLVDGGNISYFLM